MKKESEPMDTSKTQEQQQKAKAYEKYVKEKTPVHSLWKNMGAAF